MTVRSDAADRLKSYIERIERLAEDIRDIKDDQKAVFAEARAEGFVPKAMRDIVKRRDKDPAELAEQETIFRTYMHALGMAPDHPLDAIVETMAADDLSRDEVIGALQKFVPANGEIIARIGGDPVRVWRDELGRAYAEPYVDKPRPAEKIGKGAGKSAAVLSIVTGEKIGGRPVDPAIADAVERAERGAARKKREHDKTPPAAADQPSDEEAPVE